MSETIESDASLHSNEGHQKASLAALMVAALGVVYGDIGTSPLYAFQASINPEHGVPFSQANTLGIVSLLLWAVFFIVTIQYVTFIMRADNKGEGGILALMALALRSTTRESKMGRVIVALGVFGCCMLFGDAVITPAVSVLSAIEGLELVTPAFKPLTIPLTIAILAILFVIQKHGTATVGKLFGPVMILWFFTIGIIGLSNIFKAPIILSAINPWHAIHFLFSHGWHAFVVMGSVVLVVTGCEAMYLDMGHFGPKPLRRSWNCLVLPCLVANYLGQGATVLSNPKAISNPFFLSAPDWALIPLVVLATLATVIASQAVISGAYSLASQAIQLGFAPRMKVDHTSSAEIGQIYMPVVNWTLFAIIVFVVINFKTSSNLTAAYGIAVTSTMVITSLIFTVVMHRVWGWRLWLALPIGALFLICNGTFLAANLLKIKDGGWFPLMLGSLVFFLMMTWHRGRMLQRQRTVAEGIPLQAFITGLLAHPPTRVDGTAVFLAGSVDHVPVALLHNLKHNRVLHHRNVFLKFSIYDVPFIDDKDRIKWIEIGENTFTLRASYGFKETPDVHTVMALAEKQNNIHFDLMDTSFFLARDTVVPSKIPGMPIWRERLYAWMHQNGAKPSDFFQIPANRVVELGTKIEI